MFKLGLSFFAVALGGRLLWRSRLQMTPSANISINNNVITQRTVYDNHHCSLRGMFAFSRETGENNSRG